MLRNVKEPIREIKEQVLYEVNKVEELKELKISLLGCEYNVEHILSDCTPEDFLDEEIGEEDDFFDV